MADTSCRTDLLATWDLPVSHARYVDDARVEAFERLGVHTVGDLLHHFPFRYVDLTSVLSLADVRAGTEATVVGRVHAVKVKKPRPRLSIVEVGIVDGSGVLLGVWFNQPYMASRFAEGERVAFAGHVRLDYGFKQMRDPFVEKLGAEDDPEATSRLIPVHRATDGLTTNWLRRIIGTAIDSYGDAPDFLPSVLRIDRGLVSRRIALRDIHFPFDVGSRDRARRRLAYEELFCVQLGFAYRRHRITADARGTAHTIGGPHIDSLRAALPFQLTQDQSDAVDAVLRDMGSAHPMNRMLLGDVGTGKTVVAAHALAAVADTHAQAAMMAPTEVLATQYAEKVGPLLDDAGVSWGLLTGSTPAEERRRLLSLSESGDLMVLFGTHAILESDVRFATLSLAVVDEQHRFGVGQRLALRSKAGTAADMLVMTATPIPRSLALTLYGDLAATYLRTRPTGDGTHRVTTTVVSADAREEAYDTLRHAVSAGRQGYVVCPLVDESDAIQARSAIAEAERLAHDVFRELRVGLLTGRLRPAEKLDVMRRFRQGEIDVLVSTTVIEVGVDVPNATVMIVEDADRFGLAQLHQLRGRIGRGGHESDFLLFADARTEEARARMEAISRSTDGFELAEADLALRGEGQILGQRQHGLPELRLASVLTDGDLLAMAREDALSLIERDPHLEDPAHGPLAREVRSRFATAWEWVSSG